MTDSDELSFLCIGSLGTGFRESSLEKGLALDPDFIGADSGSVDGGPNALAGVAPGWPDAAFRRDLTLLMQGAARQHIPLLIGSCATSGRDWGVDWFAGMCRDAVKTVGRKLKVAKIYCELSPDYVVEKLRAGKLHRLDPAPPYDEDVIRRSVRIVGVIGAEQFQAALDRGADVVLGGRATDTSIFAAIPLARGFDPGLAWHAGKIAECGTSAAEPRRRLDVLHIAMERDSFVVQPLADDVRCTPFSVASLQLHEVADPFTMVEPGWTTDLREVRYDAVSDRAVRVSGATSVRTPYTVKLEGVERAGFQRMFMFGIRDESFLQNLDAWIAFIDGDITTRCEELLGPGGRDRVKVHIRVYGRDGIMGPREPIKQFEGHEAFFVVDVTGPDPETTETATGVIWYAFMHAKNPGWRGGATVAWPFSKSVFDIGEVFQFNVHHVIDVDDPLEPFRIEMEEIG
jgi:hypothetical protein